MTNYRFISDLILRTPFFNYTDYALNHAGEILNDPYFQGSLYMASPELHKILTAKHFHFEILTAKEKLSILRYYNRMSFRPTPFGSFASFSIIQWGQEAQIKLNGSQNDMLYVTFDQEIVLQLSEGLNESDLEKQLFYCNPTLYEVGAEFRFIKSNYTSDKKHVSFALESYERNKITAALIAFCQNGPRFGQEITGRIIKLTTCAPEAALDYLGFLVDAQIIVPDTDLNITGEDYLKRLAEHEHIIVSHSKLALQSIYTRLERIPFPSLTSLIEIGQEVKRLIPEKSSDRLIQYFYVGLERKTLSGNLSNQHQDQIIDGLKALQHLVQPISSIRLKQFIKDFKNRYDRQKVPLLHALDPEIGIGYGEHNGVDTLSDLLKKINFNRPTESPVIPLDWSPVHRLLLQRWNENKNNTDPILLKDEDLSTIPPNGSPHSSPPSLSVMFRIVDDQLFLETVGGVTGTALIGRFTCWSNQVHSLSKELASREQLANPNVIFAEIAQVSNTHADNINRRKHTYDFEIPINAISTLPLSKQIALSDLVISVVGDELVLESLSLQKVIIPRLSSAYNYNHNDLSIFRLLCDLQHQGLQSNFTFDLEHYFPGMDHYPRVVFNQTILSAAKWYLSANDFQFINWKSDIEQLTHFAVISREKGLPVHIALTKFDQQLVFNMDQKEEVLFFLECVKGMDRAMIQEFFIPENPVVTTHAGKPLISQFIAFLYTEEEVYSGHRQPGQVMSSKVKQEYIIGSRWLYLKLYCNPSVSNALLAKKLLPLLDQFDRTELDSWFFIRYRDEGYHIRLRLKVREIFIGQLLTRLKKRLHDHVHIHLIREYQADTYRRELERYGADIIGSVEGFFHASSELIVRYIKVSVKKAAKYSYHSIAFVSVAHLIDSFLPLPDDQLAFLEQMVHTFYSEFSDDKSLKIDLDKKYREIKTEIKELLNDNAYYEKQKLGNWSDLFISKIKELLKSAKHFSHKRKTQLLADLIHMHLNRLFVDQQRNHELIVYYCLHKHQLSAKAIADKSRS